MMLSLGPDTVARARHQGIPQYFIEQAALWLSTRTEIAPGRYLLSTGYDLARRLVSAGRSRIEIENLSGIALVIDDHGSVLALVDSRQCGVTEQRRAFATLMNTALARRVGH